MTVQKIIEALNIRDYFIIFVLIFATYVFNFYYKYITRPNALPGPLPLPFIGNLHNIAFCGLKTFYDKCRLKYGDICEIMLDGRRSIILSRPDYIEKLMSPVCLKRLPYSQGLVELGIYGHGIIGNDNYNSWKYNKQFFIQALMAPRFMDTAVDSTNKLFKELRGYWQSLANQNTSTNNSDNVSWTLEIDFSSWFHAFTNDIVSIIITGERTYSLASYYNTQSTVKSEHPDALVEDGNKFVKSLIKYVEGFMFFMLVGPFLRHYVPIIRNKANSYLKNRSYMCEKLDLIIKKRRKEIEEMSAGTEMRTDMLTSLIIANTEKDNINVKKVGIETFEPMIDDEIRSNLIDAFIGGTDSTANTFCCITYYLCKHPNVKQKMIKEIDSVFSSSSNKSYLTNNDLLKLKYCEAIIKETSRIIPIANFVSRYMTEEYEVAGYKWTANTLFHLNVVGLHGHPNVWPNPEVFDPDRFYNVDKDNDKRLENKCSLIIFGVGPRICPGRKMAMGELLSFMASFYRYYNVELVNMHEPLKIAAASTNSVKELKVRISPRII
ncbi:cytochrome P450 [Gigaspora margarita]|uniref:Cytochrome P450 n=1 Tax=Gigaspora margarita TaxID=4874 RepID=A0A8H4EV93_GIGMA|nr:cytochrome P450 [Gigaspora margarita]